MIRTSIWEKRHFFKHYDVVVIGAGLIGLCSALYLRQMSKSLKILIVERSSIPLGASTRNAGFACFGSPSEILSDLESQSFSDVCELIKKRYDGWKMLLQLVGPDQLKYEATGGYEVFLKDREVTFSKCLDLIKPINEATRDLLGLELYSEYHDHTTGLDNFAHVISAPHEGLIDPGSMIKHLIRMVKESDIDLYTGLDCEQLFEHEKQVEIETSRGMLSADQVIVATNGFANQLIPTTEILPVRNQVLVTSALKQPLHGAYHCDQGYLYFRNVGTRLLIGGGRNIAAEEEATAHFDMTAKIRDNLVEFLESYLIQEHYEIEYEWSGILGFDTSKIPEVRRQSPRLVLAAGMGGMGIAIGAAIAHEAASEILC